MGRKWQRTPEQDQYLLQSLIKFPEARTRGRQAVYFADLIEGWFKHWPERGVLFGLANISTSALTQDQQDLLTEAIFLRKEQLKNYIYWHSDKDRNARRRKRTYTLADLLKREKRTRRKQLAEVYSKLFFKTKIGPEVEKAMLASAPTAPESKKQFNSRKMATMRRIRAEMWANESEEVRQQVAEAREKEEMKQKKAKNRQRKKNQSEDGDEEEDESDEEEADVSDEVASMKLLGEEIANLGPILTAVTRELQERTGWIMTILCGGLNMDGELQSASMHCGHTEAGHTFQESTVDYQEKILEPWTFFLERVFSVEKQCLQATEFRKAYGLPDKPESEPVSQVKTQLWSLKDDGDNEFPDNEVDLIEVTASVGVVDQPATTADNWTRSTTCIPVSSERTTFVVPTTPKSSVEPLATAQPLPTDAGHGLSSTPPAFTAEAPGVPVPMLDSAVNASNESGLYLTLPPQEHPWQGNDYYSLTDELNFGPGGLYSLVSSAQHPALLDQNTHPYGSEAGMGLDPSLWSYTVSTVVEAAGVNAASTPSSQASASPPSPTSTANIATSGMPVSQVPTNLNSAPVPSSLPAPAPKNDTPTMLAAAITAPAKTPLNSKGNSRRKKNSSRKDEQENIPPTSPKPRPRPRMIRSSSSDEPVPTNGSPLASQVCSAAITETPPPSSTSECPPSNGPDDSTPPPPSVTPAAEPSGLELGATITETPSPSSTSECSPSNGPNDTLPSNTSAGAAPPGTTAAHDRPLPLVVVPLQSHSVNTPASSRPIRERKRKIHRDEAFEMEQEALKLKMLQARESNKSNKKARLR